jgi:hypothetical protein
MEMLTKNPQTKKLKNKKFTCEICDYITSNKKDFNKHFLTRKHEKNTLKNVKKPQKESKKNRNVERACIYCGKRYKHRSSLSRHQQKCDINDISVVEKPKKKSFNDNNANIKNPQNEMSKDKMKIQELEKKIEKLKDEKKDVIIDQQAKMIDILKTSNNTNNFNNCNNKITLNVYLNEHCKDAMNLTDFVNKIQVSLEDLEYSKQNGFAKGITNILTKQLEDLNPTERPIHCSDAKRLEFYVKDDDKWEKETSNDKIDASIMAIQVKTIKKLRIWEDEHPGWEGGGKLGNDHQKFLVGILNEMKQDKKNIKKSITSQLNVKDEIKKLN